MEKTGVIIAGIGLIIISMLAGIISGFLMALTEVKECWDNVEKPKDTEKDSNESDS